ncbi:MAG TPA: prepilin-type N-terminal cleavage/methylation domain-containing protein [Desulfotomaculum sp.]|nr:prepilin-type N-terminal cleavage/methylation domain-containing protein [Desulfotomaculum sp.]
MFGGLLRRRGFRLRDERGLTLIELVAVVVILGIVAVLLVPRVIGRADEARVNAALSDIRAMKSVLETYYSEYGELPDSNNIGAVMQAGGIYWSGDDKGVTDPWGRGYGYYRKSDTEYWVASKGSESGKDDGDEIFATEKIQPTQGKPGDYGVALTTATAVSNDAATNW